MLWFAAVVIAVAASVYQRVTGPTYPVKGSAEVGGASVSFKLLRSWDGENDADVRIQASDAGVGGTMSFRRHPSHDDWATRDLVREGEELVARIPHQPKAGKVMYQITLNKGDSLPIKLTSSPILIRFRGAVPEIIVIPHILGMVGAMLFAARTALEAWAKGAKTYPLALLTILSLVIGGFIFGPLMQKYAFDTYWAGWPLGGDLTDNKTAAAMLIWLLALWQIRKNRRKRAWAIGAAAVMLAVWLIPHSVLGSELDFTRNPPQ